MALDPLTIGAGLALGYVLVQSNKPKRRRRRKATPAAPKPTAPQPRDPVAPPALPRLEIAPDCSAWTIPDAWIVQVAQPRFRALLVQHNETMRAGLPATLDPVAATYAIVQGELGPCPEPLVAAPAPAPPLNFLQLQSDVESTDDYYPHAAILGLYGHIYEAVIDATQRYATTTSVDELLFPV